MDRVQGCLDPRAKFAEALQQITDVNGLRATSRGAICLTQVLQPQQDVRGVPPIQRQEVAQRCMAALCHMQRFLSPARLFCGVHFAASDPGSCVEAMLLNMQRAYEEAADAAGVDLRADTEL